ncbi:MAG: aminotransferase class V-fold PLP-dependent enzyme [Candidatus Saccharibacteria bacterium]
MFSKKQNIQNTTDRLPDFNYINNSDIYMDTSCQSMRPQPVIDAIANYYQTYNACGSRVKYKWGQRVDSAVEATRELVINYLGLPQKEYVCSFTLNTTFGINLILNQLPKGYYEQVITSEIEHNSVFLPTIELAKRLEIDRKVLKRADDGSLIYTKTDLNKSVIVVNATSNIDGRLLLNIKQLIKDAHTAGGIVIIDAAQAAAHYQDLLFGCQADAFCFSAHKMYAASLGVIVIKKDLIRSLDKHFVGGGMVSAVQEQGYDLLPDDLNSWLEPGLQAYGEIISLKRAIEWLSEVKPQGLKPAEYIHKISKQLYDGLSEIPGLTILNKQPSSVISVYSNNVDAHRLAIFLSAAGIMVRSGYFCCHYYLIEKLQLPPLLRISIGLHTTEDDVTKTIKTLKKVLKA